VTVSFNLVLEQVRITTIEYLSDLSFIDLRSSDTLLYKRNQVLEAAHELSTDSKKETFRVLHRINKPGNGIIFDKQDIYLMWMSSIN